MYIVLDTETTGLPADWNAPPTNVDNWPRIIQLGFQVYDRHGNLIKEYDQLIKPDGWVIPNGKFWTEHGFSTAENEARGIPIQQALECLIQWINDSDYLICHNIKYDFNVVAAEMIRKKLKAKKSLEKICTMNTSAPILKLPSRGYGLYKSPKLIELHKYLFKEGFDGAHDALADVKATARCFFELKQIPNIQWLK